MLNKEKNPQNVNAERLSVALQARFGWSPRKTAPFIAEFNKEVWRLKVKAPNRHERIWRMSRVLTKKFKGNFDDVFQCLYEATDTGAVRI